MCANVWRSSTDQLINFSSSALGDKISLYELNRCIAEVINTTFDDHYWVVAEISEIRTASNGHCYLELIEKSPRSNAIVARARATIWSNRWMLCRETFESVTGQRLAAGMKILVCVVVLLVCAVLFVYFRQRLKIKKVENRELRNNLQQEALIYSMNRKNFEQDIKQKECEISSSTLLLANKNEVLQQISDITRKYQEMGSIPAEYVKQVNDVIGDSLKNDDEWQRFKLHFDSVHPDFFVKLKEAGTGLTENDLRLCAYIRIGMRAKQIAEMLSVSPDSVNSNRYRLRKKLKIQKGDSLDDFIRKI